MLPNFHRLLLPVLAAVCNAAASETAVAGAGARHTFESAGRAPDGRVQYVFTTRGNAVTNTVFMGGFVGGRQLLGYAPGTKTLTLSGPGGKELALATGGSFTQSAASPAASGETGEAGAVASCGSPPQNAVVKTVSVSLSQPVLHLGAGGVSSTSISGAGGISAGSVSLGAPVRRVSVSRAEGGATGVVTVKPNEYFFGTQYMYPTRFEVGTYTTTGANGAVVAVPFVVPRDFRTHSHGIQGTNK